MDYTSQVLSSNFVWMGWNLFLALIGLGLAYWLVTVRQKFVKTAVALIWILFVPNTLYLLTDVIHLFRQWDLVPQLSRVVLLAQYLTLIGLGIFTYVKSMGLVESGLYRWARSGSRLIGRVLESRMDVVMAGMNYLIAFGVVMGRFMRTNSWYVFTHPERVVSDILRTALSVQLMIFVLGFFAVTHGIYLAYKKYSY
jgi:uncharacterized membrane protein